MPNTRSKTSQVTINFRTRKASIKETKENKYTESLLQPKSPTFKPISPQKSTKRQAFQEDQNIGYHSPEKITKQETVEQNDDQNLRKRRLSLAKRKNLQYNKVKSELHASLPETMPCREKELKTITTFLTKRIAKRKSGSLYLSGAPGTGKTAGLQFALRNLDDNKDLNYEFCFVNCMAMKQSQSIYSKIASTLFEDKKTFTNKDAIKYLEQTFTTDGPMIVLILDEIDHLESKNQDVLYKIFDWPAANDSRLVIIGIANSLDLTDRILPRLQCCKQGAPKLIHFEPYKKEEIVKILETRIGKGDDEIVDSKAIQFCARKVSSVAGDMRKALAIMRRAIDVVDNNARQQHILAPIDDQQQHCDSSNAKLPKVGLSHVASVISEVYGSRVVSLCSSQNAAFPMQQKVLVCTLLLISKQFNLKQTTLDKLYKAYVHICKRRQMSPVSQEDLLGLCDLLESNGIFGIKRRKTVQQNLIYLRLQEAEVEQTLKDSFLLSAILQESIPGKCS